MGLGDDDEEEPEEGISREELAEELSTVRRAWTLARNGCDGWKATVEETVLMRRAFGAWDEYRLGAWLGLND